jgi:sortase A
VKNFRFPTAIGATALVTALVAFSFLPLSRAGEPEPQRVAVVSAPEEATTATVLPTKPRPATGEKTKKALRERLAREQAAQEQAAQAESAGKETEGPQKAGVSISVLPGPSRETLRGEAPSAGYRPVGVPPGVVTGPEPADDELSISIPKLGIEDVPVGDSPDQEYLDREGIMHLTGTDFPYERGSNTYIVGHAADFDASRIPNVFHDLNALRPGDIVTLRDSTGRSYDYRIYDRFVVEPTDVWVTRPIAGRNIVSLQTCFPEPSFEKRLIVRGQLVS